MAFPMLTIFLLLFGWVLMSIVLGLKFYDSRRRQHVTQMLKTITQAPAVIETKLLRDPAAQNHTLFERLLARLNLEEKLAKQLKQSGVDWSSRQLLAWMGLGAAAGAIVGAVLPVAGPVWLRSAALAAVLGMAPYLAVRRRLAKRLAACEEQLPEALDFLSRSMRAGHAFTISLEMLSEELADPLGLEFRTLFNEQNLGAPIEVALRNLTERVPLLDVRFFASAVMLQKQTGGNLSEILTRLSYVIRERFRLKGQVKAASAHGRMTASILTALPIFTMLGLLVVAPGYLQGMAADSDGKYLIGGALAAQIIGNGVIKKIIRIKV